MQNRPTCLPAYALSINACGAPARHTGVQSASSCSSRFLNHRHFGLDVQILPAMSTNEDRGNGDDQVG